jgi:hypothetical protein
MGYDMTWENVPAETEERTMQAFRKGDEANNIAKAKVAEVLARRPDAVKVDPFTALAEQSDVDPELLAIELERQTAWEEFESCNVSYYRLNIWGMGRCREAMQHYNMLAFGEPEYDYSDLPNFPEPEEEHWDDDMEPLTHEAREYRMMQHRILSAGSPDPGIPIWKLCSNDGWLVTPQECLQALERAPQAARAYNTMVSELPEPERSIVASYGMALGMTEQPKEAVPEELEWWGSWLDFLRGAALNGGFRVY